MQCPALCTLKVKHFRAVLQALLIYYSSDRIGQRVNTLFGFRTLHYTSRILATWWKVLISRVQRKPSSFWFGIKSFVEKNVVLS